MVERIPKDYRSKDWAGVSERAFLVDYRLADTEALKGTESPTSLVQGCTPPRQFSINIDQLQIKLQHP